MSFGHSKHRKAWTAEDMPEFLKADDLRVRGLEGGAGCYAIVPVVPVLPKVEGFASPNPLRGIVEGIAYQQQPNGRWRKCP